MFRVYQHTDWFFFSLDYHCLYSCLVFVLLFVLIGYCVCISIESADRFGFYSLIGRVNLVCTDVSDHLGRGDGAKAI